MFADTLCPRMAQRCIVRGFIQIKTNNIMTSTCSDLMGCWTIMAAVRRITLYFSPLTNNFRLLTA